MAHVPDHAVSTAEMIGSAPLYPSVASSESAKVEVADPSKLYLDLSNTDWLEKDQDFREALDSLSRSEGLEELNISQNRLGDLQEQNLKDLFEVIPKSVRA